MLERMLYLMIFVGLLGAWAMLTIMGGERVRLQQELDARLQSQPDNTKT